MDPEVKRLRSRADSLVATFKQRGETSYIDEAIDSDREALELCPSGHPERSISLSRLALHLHDRYGRVGAIRDLDEAIVLGREALDLCARGHPGWAMTVCNLALFLVIRYQQLGAMQDLDEAIVLGRETLDLLPKRHPNRSMSLNNLSICLSIRYEQLGATQDLDEAIVLDQEALRLRPQGHPDRSSSLINLANRLFYRYKELGITQDLDEAIVLDREALSLCPQGHPDRLSSVNGLANHLSSRYDQFGVMQDLDEAIVLAREALRLCLPGNPQRSLPLSNLAISLSTRYEQLGAMQDLEEAIVLDREALELRPRSHPLRSRSLNNLAIRFSTRYNQLGDIQDLDEAIVLDREALHLRPQGEPRTDLDEAMVLNREALELRPPGHPLRYSSLNNLATCLSTKYKQLEAMQDLDEIIVLSREALELQSQGHPGRSDLLYNLAVNLYSRFTRSKRSEDKEEVFSLFTQLADVAQVVSSADLSASRAWISMAEHLQHPTLLLGYETSLRLLVQHLATLPSLPQHLTILKKRTSSLAVDAFSACLRSGSLAKAVELLEQGRGVFWSQLTRLRSPLDDVTVSGPEGKQLASEFSRLASLIRNALNTPGPDQHEQVYRLNLEMQNVVSNIRRLPGLSRFLFPSLFSDLQHSASGGPVIIVNASQYGCDALVIFFGRDPVHIPLQITQEIVYDLSNELYTLTKRTTRANVTRELAFFLRKLWDQIVSPIVEFLQTALPSQSRIWWCPTAKFSMLPLHAAGPYRKGHLNLPDLYVSSYTPTLTALVRARRHGPSSCATGQKCFVAIGQAKPIGETELLSVGAELDNIAKSVGSLATFTRIDGEASCIARVVEELRKTEWVHFACHGLPNQTWPFESAFALHDGHFAIQQIIRCDLQNPEFAYLSACHTTVGDKDSPDEVIHLASAMQFAGFRSVIGTVWAVDDDETNKITSAFYKYMVDESGRLDHTRAAFALNKTMKSVHVPFDQRILYIHLGA